ncbi:MAG: anaerobic ribonucleoside-triphosphate reductase activating protein [Oscillospiraceae bacterium]|nr:anaerobic ribonucleoside-triphosphate reductase activating protein [Oscillospiraceae bacterium]
MKIHGLQKLTLLDFHEHVACTVFLGGCDFRCPFCHNFELAEGKLPPIMEEEELLSFLKSRQGLLDGVAFTGGEPCLHPGLPDLMAKIRDLGYATKLDSNGYHPARLREIIDRGLADYVAMDIKNSPAKYAMTCGIESVDLDVIRESIGLLMERAPDYEFRTTVVAEFHEAADFHAMGEMIRGARRYFLQCFTDRDSVPFGNLHAPTKAQLEEFRDISKNYVPDTELRGVD